MNSSSKLPNIKWAERKDRLYITVQLEDAKDPKIEIVDNQLRFS